MRSRTRGLIVLVCLVTSMVMPAPSALADDAPDALHRAVQSRDLDLIKELIGKGYKPTKPHAKEGTAMDVASKFGTAEIYQYLLDHGGKHADTHLQQAVLYRRIDIAKLLLDRKVSPNLKSSRNRRYPLLFDAIMTENTDMVKLLVDAGAEAVKASGNSKTPLEMAVTNGNGEMVDYLMAKGAKVRSPEEGGKYAQIPEPWIMAAGTGDVDAIKALIAGGLDVNQQDDQQFTMANYAARCGRVDVLRALKDAGYDINAKRRNGAAIHVAARHSTPEAVKGIIKLGGNIDSTDSAWGTPLCLAVERAHVDMVNMLLDMRAQIHVPRSDAWDRAASEIRSIQIQESKGLNPANREAVFEVARTLLKRGVDLTHKPQHGEPPLHKLAEEGNAYVLQIMLESGMKADENLRGTRPTPLTLAAEAGQLECVRVLLENRADPDGKPYRLGSYKRNDPPIVVAARGGHGDIVKLLIKHRANVNDKFAIQNTTALGEAIGKCKPDVIEALLDAGAKVDVEDRDGRTPLWMAAHRRDNAAMRLLLDHKAKVDIGMVGSKPINAALSQSDPEAVQMLLDAGVNLDISAGVSVTGTVLDGGLMNHKPEIRLAIAKYAVDKRMRLSKVPPEVANALAGRNDTATMTVLMDAGMRFDQPGQHGRSPLHSAAGNSAVEAVELLIKRGVKVNAVNAFYQTALHEAAQSSKDPKVVKVLIDAGADVNFGRRSKPTRRFSRDDPRRFDIKATETGITPLHVIVGDDRAPIAEMLLDKGADPNVHIYTGETPLLIVAKHGDAKLVELYLKHKADVRVTDGDGNSALHLACMNNRVDTVKLLLAAGIDTSLRNEKGETAVDIAKSRGRDCVALIEAAAK